MAVNSKVGGRGTLRRLSAAAARAAGAVCAATGRHAADATRHALFERLVESSIDGIVAAGRDGNVRLINRAALAMLGRPLEDALGGPLDRVLPGAFDLAEELERSRAALGDKRPHASHELGLVRRDGKRIDLELVVGSVDLAPGRRDASARDAERTYYTFTLRDITARKRKRAAERRAAQRALASNRAKTEFLAGMSHELRTPLNAIIGFSDTIHGEIFGPISPPRYREYAHDIAESGRHLLAIINDILDVSRIELGQYRIGAEIVDMRAVLEACVKMARGWPSFAERRFRADLAGDLPEVKGDARVLKQTVINLLSNAFKYSRPGDTIELSAAAEAGGRLIVKVRDSGPGIAAEHLPNLTQPFFQVDATMVRRAEGAGLGLFLTASFAKLHGGDLRIESELGLGTTVTLRLPVPPAAAAAGPPAGAIAAPA